MTGKIKRLFSFLLAKDKNLSLENRLVFSSVLVAIFFTFIIDLMGNILDMSVYLKIPGYFVLATLIGLYLLMRFRQVKSWYIFALVFLCLFSNASLWIFGGGLDSQNIIILSVTLVLSIIIVPAKKRIHVLVSYIALVLLEYMVEKFRPDFISGYTLGQSRWLDGLTTTLYSIIFLFLIVQFLLKNYLYEKIKAERSEKNLQNLNKTLESRIVERTMELTLANLRLKLANEAGNSGSWDWDLVNNTFYWSDEFMKLCDMDSPVEQGLLWMKKLHPDDFLMAEKVFRYAIENKIQLVNEYRIKMNDNSIKWIRTVGKATYDNDKPLRMTGISMDISDIKERERELEIKNHILRIAGETALFGTWYYDVGTQTLKWSEEVKKIQEVSDDNRPDTGRDLDFIAPEFRERFQCSFINCVRNGISFDEIVQVLTQKGRCIWVRFTGEAERDTGGKIVRLIGSFQDIDIIKRNEEEVVSNYEKFSALLNSAAEGIYGLDLNGDCIFVNMSFLKILGFENEEQLLGKNMHNLIHHSYPDGRPMDIADCRLNRSIKEKTGTHADDEFLWKTDGSYIPVEFWSFPLSLHGRIQGAVVTFFDITERKKAEKELYTAKLEAEIANSAKSKFLLNISHEFRTPLNAVLGYADLLESAEGKSRHDYTEAIKSSGRRLLDMVNNILELIRSEKSGLELDYEYVDLFTFFSEFENIFRSNFAEKRLKFRTELARDLPSMIFTDEKRLNLVIDNLIDNAIKFTEYGEVVLKVYQNKNKIHGSRSKTNLIIEIKDTGIGIADENQKLIFEAFSQVEKKTISSGIGIGLSLSYRIISTMNGTIDLISQPGMGSRFIITLHNMSVKKGEKTNGQFFEPKYEAPYNETADKNDIVDPAGLISELEGSFHSKWLSFEAIQPLSEVKKFGLDLIELGTRHSCNIVFDYGKNLADTVDSFDVNGMLKQLKKYQANIELLKSRYQL
jgi:PAS domain S-box-containing protein